MHLRGYACYLVALCASVRKKEAALAKTYFAMQTGRQELNDQGQAQLLPALAALRDLFREQTGALVVAVTKALALQAESIPALPSRSGRGTRRRSGSCARLDEVTESLATEMGQQRRARSRVEGPSGRDDGDDEQDRQARRLNKVVAQFVVANGPPSDDDWRQAYDDVYDALSGTWRGRPRTCPDIAWARWRPGAPLCPQYRAWSPAGGCRSPGELVRSRRTGLVATPHLPSR